MNFSDKLKIDKDLTGPGYDLNVIQGLNDPGEMSFTAEMDPEQIKRLLMKKELNPGDIIRPGMEIIEGATKNVPALKEDKEKAKCWYGIMKGYLEALVSTVFGVICNIEEIEISEEDEDE